MFKQISSTIALTFSISKFFSLFALALELPLVFPLKQSQATPPEFSDSPSGQNQENQAPNPSDSFPPQDLGDSSPKPSASPLEQNQQNQVPNPSEPSLRQRSQQVTIPRSSAVTVTFCSNLQFDPQQKGSFPVTLFLARPILDRNGNVIAPVNTLVRAKLEPTEEKEDEEEDEDKNQGFKIKPEALVIGGRFIPIETSSVSIPTLASARQDNNYTYSSYGGQGWQGPVVQVADQLVGSGGLLESQRVLDRGTSDLLSLGLAIASGVTAGLSQPKPPDPEDNEIMEVSEGIQLIFPLKTSVVLPTIATHQNPYFANQAASGSACSGNSGLSPSGNGNYYETNNQNQNGYYETNNQNQPNESNSNRTNNDQNSSYQRNGGTSDEYD